MGLTRAPEPTDQPIPPPQVTLETALLELGFQTTYVRQLQAQCHTLAMEAMEWKSRFLAKNEECERLQSTGGLDIGESKT